ncbi:RecT family recombinase [Bacillus mycoides]|uniref:RecT family recombinase n=1 Tax=Bacillus mycoides TaxID=1405 RepID=UPI000B4B7139|nr:RecT family recombinase [Bacillus mycoides]
MTNPVTAAPNTDKVIGNFTKSELDTIKSTIATGTSNEQFALFVQTCVNSELNPFLNHIYCIVYGGKMSIQVSVEGVLHLARQKNGYKGIDVQTVHENDEFEADRSQEGEWIIRKHQVKFPRGKVIGCYAVAQRDGFKDVVVMMETDEVIHMKNGTNKHMWNNWFNDMFKKHAMKRAAKLQYGIEINEDEAVSSSPVDNVQSYEPEKRVDITPNKPNQIQVEDGETVNPEEEMKNQWEAINSKLKGFGMTKNDLKAIITEKFNQKPTELTLQQIAALSKFIDLERVKRQKQSEVVVELVEVIEVTAEEPPQSEIDFENMEMNFA